jgi:hypothetical protein
MATLRSVNTRFWEDPWVESLSPSEKLLFLYLLTCKYANLAGIYEITIKRISFETGLDNETVSNGLKRFAKDNKAYFVEGNYMFLPNWLKNQKLNANMKKNVLSIFCQLPKDLSIRILGNDYLTIRKDYQMLSNALLKYEVEDEVEVEVKEEVEEEKGGDKSPLTPKIDLEFRPKKDLEFRKREFATKVYNEAVKIGYTDQSELKNFFDYWTEHGANDKKMRFEKEKTFGINRRLSTWFKNVDKFQNNGKNRGHNKEATSLDQLAEILKHSFEEG